MPLAPVAQGSVDVAHVHAVVHVVLDVLQHRTSAHRMPCLPEARQELGRSGVPQECRTTVFEHDQTFVYSDGVV